MNDPALTAAQRSIDSVGLDEFTNAVGDTALAAAREALKPLRELHHHAIITRTSPRNSRHEYPVTVCDECQYEWPCETAPLIYTAEELAAMPVVTG